MWIVMCIIETPCIISSLIKHEGHLYNQQVCSQVLVQKKETYKHTEKCIQMSMADLFKSPEIRNNSNICQLMQGKTNYDTSIQ